MIHDGKIFGTVDQDPYPQAYNAMKMAWLHFNGKDADIQKPYFLPLPLITGERRENAGGLGLLIDRLSRRSGVSPRLRRFGERLDAVSGRVHHIP